MDMLYKHIDVLCKNKADIDLKSKIRIKIKLHKTYIT